MKKELRKEIRQENNTETEEKDSDSMLSRRQFMKTAGLGIGVLSLSSLTSAWSLIQPSSQGTSDIDADTVDGSQAGDIGSSIAAENPSEVDMYDVQGEYGYNLVADITGSGCLLGDVLENPELDPNDYIRVIVDGDTFDVTYSQ